MSAFTFGGECQFGEHSEPFLQFGSENDVVNIAIFQLIELATIDLDLAIEISEEISAELLKRKSLILS